MNTLEPTGLEAAIDAYLACRPKSTTACQDFGMQQRERISQQVTSAIRAYLSALPAAPMPGVKATEEQIDAAIREWMSDDDRSADGFRRRMRAALSALDVPAHPEGVKDAREFWLHYDGQVGRWCVEREPPKVVRPDAEIIHMREV